MNLNVLQRFLIISLCVALIYSCSSLRSKQRGDQKEVDSQQDYRSFFLIGNLSSNQGDQGIYLETAVDFIKTKAREQDYTLILGDNIEAKKVFARDNDSTDFKILKNQLDLIKNIPGGKYVIPGDHDWNDEGLSGLKKIEELVEDRWDDKEAFQPENACPIEDISISESMHLFIVDSEWYIRDWNSNPLYNDECEIRSRKQFLYVLGDEMRKQRHKTVILAMHHPVYTNGLYGGRVSSYNLYKPTIENAYLPFLGSAWSFIRSQGGVSRQDRYNPMMNELMEEIKVMSLGIDRFFVLSGHERSLQYIEDGNVRQLISGSIHETQAAALGKRGLFASGQHGFAELRVFKDQSSTVHLYEIENGNVEKVYENIAFAKAENFNIDSLPPVTGKFKKSSIYSPQETDVDEDHEKFYGKHYRNLYGLKVKAPMVMLDTLYGGLKVERPGGGNQTQGLRLVDSLDREFNMRALEKDALQFLKSTGYDKLDAEKYFTKTFPQELVRDFYTAAHPYGAFAIPKLADAIDVKHTHPKLFYVPKQSTLGNFNKTHGDRLYMIVEKPDDSFDSPHMFGNNEDVESTTDLFEKIRKDEENVVDESSYIRARIFDMLIGDWDRHEDQWRWAQIPDPNDEDKHTFIAIPRDRDQVFSRFDGKLFEFLRKYMSSVRQFGVYGPDIEHIKEFSQSAVHLDRAILQKTSLEDWRREAKYIQNRITPEIVKQAFNDMPDEVKDDTWKETQNDLLARKENLESIAERFYEQFLYFQTLKGTDKDDHFVITRLAGGITQVKAYRIIDGEKGTLLFNRTFDLETTRDLWIYGLDDGDIFEVTGNAEGAYIPIAISGGQGDDVYKVENGKKIKIYDYESEDNELENNGAFVVFRDDYDINQYDPEKEPKRQAKITFKNNYNPDLGYVPTLGYVKEVVDFEANPYSRKYGMNVEYHSLTQAAVFKPTAGLSNVIGHWNLEFDGLITTNNYTENFFGYGNDTDFNPDTDYDQNRVLLQRRSAIVSLDKKGNYGSHFNVGVGYQNIGVENFDNDQFGLLKLNYKYKSIDSEQFTTHGLEFNLSTSFTDNLSNDQAFFSVDPKVTLWNAIDRNRRLILKTSIAAQSRIGDQPLFYQAATLGAANGLRGYRMNRFNGDVAARASADILYEINPIKTRLLPLQVTAYSGFDTGKVWWENSTTDRFYTSYGGGLEFLMSGLFVADVSYFYGSEGGRLQLGLRFSK
ncbi:MAG: metallophosphoesterase [Nonlabens sp.]